MHCVILTLNQNKGVRWGWEGYLGGQSPIHKGVWKGGFHWQRKLVSQLLSDSTSILMELTI
jgi:hypothetical protein